MGKKLYIKKDEEREKRFRSKGESGGAFGFSMFVGVSAAIIITLWSLKKIWKIVVVMKKKGRK